MWKSKKKIEREVDEELEFHLSMAAAERERTGRDVVAARVEAERAFGDRGAIRRACVREAVGLRRYVVAAAAVAMVGSLVFAVKLENDPWSRVSPFTRVEQSASAVEV